MRVKFRRTRFSPSVGLLNRMSKMLVSELNQCRLEAKEELSNVLMMNSTKAMFAQDSTVADILKSTIARLKNRWSKRFNLFSDTWTKTLTSSTDKQVGSQLDLFFDSPTSIKVPMSDRTKNIMKAMSDKASSLVVSIQDNYADDLEQSVYRLMTQQGLTFSGFQKSFNSMLQDKYKTHRNKALNVALDQTRKVYQTTATRKLVDAGVDEFIWRHAGGSKEPRPYHKFELNGKKFRFDDPPVIDKRTGEKGLPSQAINCKCYIEPVI